jgi:predicted nuclease of predicted toxin-antitoxin system
VKLLFDENLSHRLVEQVTDVYPGSIHVRDVGLLGAADTQIWEYAAEHGFLLASKDTDFYQRSLVFGAPPKVVWLRIGNAPKASIATMLRERYLQVRRFVDDAEATFLPLGPAQHRVAGDEGPGMIS